MALNIKDPETERLVAELAARTGETKTAAVRTAVRERAERFSVRRAPRDREQALRRFLTEEAWSQIPRSVLGKPVSRAEREAILGYGGDGV